jgi:hypothetical protein
LIGGAVIHALDVRFDPMPCIANQSKAFVNLTVFGLAWKSQGIAQRPKTAAKMN